MSDTEWNQRTSDTRWGTRVSDSVGFGVIGANSFVANQAVLPAIEAASNARLVATASRSSEVPECWASTDVGSYEAVLEHPDVEAVYIPLPNGMHRDWTEKTAAVGKHVLCEKPLASDVETAEAMADACERAGVLLAEAWMTPFHRRYGHVFDIARLGDLGRIERIEARFTFTIGPDALDNYRWDPQQGGGALLDVGIYCLGPIVELFDARPSGIVTHQQLTDRGVDAATRSELSWPDGRTASIDCSFVDDDAQTLAIAAERGTLQLDSEAFTGGVDDRVIRMYANHAMQMPMVDANDSYQSMIEAFARAVRGESRWPRPAERSIEMLHLIARIRDAARD